MKVTISIDELRGLAETALRAGMRWAVAEVAHTAALLDEPDPGPQPVAADIVNEWIERERS